MPRPACVASMALGLAAFSAGPAALAQRAPDGAALVRLLGARAVDAFSPPGTRGIGALVRLPAGVRAGDLGLSEMAPGIARLWGPPADILSFADAHPGLPLEVAPPLHLLLDTAAGFVASDEAIKQGLDGSGVLVGIADTGLDLLHPDFIDTQGHTRVAWLLDLSAAPRGAHVDLEKTFGTLDGSNNVVAGAVWSANDIDDVIASGQSSLLPQDELGHGTLVTSCAAGNGAGGKSRYRGVAPAATILLARITTAGTSAIGNDDLLRGVAFLFDRADAMKRPVVVNMSIGTDFGPHDGTMAWEKTLASYVGPGHPGHALVAAAGNSGSIIDTPVHQNVHVSAGPAMRVPIFTGGAQNGGVQVWVAMHDGTTLSVGLDGPQGTWISPVGAVRSAGKTTKEYSAGIYNGSQAAGSPVPPQTHGAVIVWQGSWPSGTYTVTLAGSGTADLYVQGTGDASVPGVSDVGFAHAVRESTINLPATNAAIIGVGCTINKRKWLSVNGIGIALAVPALDAIGGAPDPLGQVRDAVDGEPCWFSSAGPTLTGVEKPEIMAPGAAIVGALSAKALPPSESSIFTNPTCPTTDAGAADPACQQVDALHGVSFGTSFSSPIVAGAVAVLFQHDPTLTQDVIVAALQGGAHRLRGASPFEDQAGAGEVDVLGAVEASDRLRDPQLALPDRRESWMTLGADQYLADGSTPLQAVVELRAAAAGASARPPADGFGDGRLLAYALVDGRSVAGAVQSLSRRGPGVWVATVRVPRGLGGSSLTVGATFDGADIVSPKSVPIATDAWNAGYPPSVRGGCAVSATTRAGENDGGAPARAALALILAVVLSCSRQTSGRRRSHRREAGGPHPGRLAGAVERKLEEDRSDHLVDRDGRDGERAKWRADARELAGDDHRQTEREPRL
jgi:subtilisin family serine protease